MTFSSQIEARQFLINKITGQAGRAAAQLSDAELRMLQLNLKDPESAGGIPVELLQDTSKTFEMKIAGLLQAAYSRDKDSPKEQQKYREAVHALQDTSHYILIIAADAIPRRKSLGKYAIYILIALAMVGMILGLQLWTRGKIW